MYVSGGYGRCWSHGSTTLGYLLAGGQTGGQLAPNHLGRCWGQYTGPRPGLRGVGDGACAAGASGSDPDVCRLGSLLALGDIELGLLSFLQAAAACAGDRAEVHEHVRAALDRDEAVAFVAVEHLHSALRHLDLLVVHA